MSLSTEERDGRTLVILTDPARNRLLAQILLILRQLNQRKSS